MSIVGKVGFTGSIAVMQTEKFVFTAEQMRTLNSVPIALITPPTPTCIVVPTLMYPMVKAGSVPFSNPLALSIALDAASSVFAVQIGNPFDGSGSFVFCLDCIATLSNTDYLSKNGIGTPLFLIGASDETGGDGTVMTLIINYQIVDTAGLV